MDIVQVAVLAGWGLFLTFILIVAAALIHEAGHALAWTLLGGRVREVGYASPRGAALRVRVGELTLAFNPFTSVAYTLVEGSREQLSPESKLQRIFVHGAGIGANILAAAVGLTFSDPLIRLFAGTSAILAVQNVLFEDGRRVFSALWRSGTTGAHCTPLGPQGYSISAVSPRAPELRQPGYGAVGHLAGAAENKAP